MNETEGMSEEYAADIEANRKFLATFYYPLNQDLYKLLDSLGYKGFSKFKHDEIAE